MTETKLNLPDHLEPPKRRDDKERAQDREKGLTYIDPNWESPSYVHCYAEAARSLAVAINEDRSLLDELGLPLLYLVRHAVELVLKALLSDALGLARYRRVLEQSPTFDPQWETEQALDGSHDLRDLLKRLDDALEKLNLDSPAKSLVGLVDTIRNLERGNETAFRYPYRRKQGRRLRTFEETVRLPVLDLQQQLDGCINEHLVDRWGSEESIDHTLQGKLWRESNSLSELGNNIDAQSEQEEAHKRAYKEATSEFERWLKDRVNEQDANSATFAACHRQLVATVNAKLGLDLE